MKPEFPEITETLIPPSEENPAGAVALDVAVGPQDEPSADYVLSHSTSDFIEVTVEKLKAQLLKVPINAYTEALRLAEAFHRQGMDHMTALYREAASQLRHDGYAPTFEGQPGPAVRDYYARQAGATRRG